MNYPVGVPTEIRMESWAIPKEGMSLKQLATHLKAVGNEILEIDKKGRRIKVADMTDKL